MRQNLLLDKIFFIQREYRKMLEYLVPKLKNNYDYTALDEIALFWTRYVEEVQLYLKYWVAGKDSYVFTTSSSLDFNQRDYIPFLLLGKNHIVDDPLRKYIEILTKLSKGKNTKILYRQISYAASANLEVLNKLEKQILILPIRLLNQKSSYHFLFELGEYAFISLFNSIDSLENYFEKCDTYEDIIRFARSDIEDLVMFSDDDNKALPFKIRFQKILEETYNEWSISGSDANKFFMIVFGYIQQAIEVIVSCIEYECIPYTIHPVSLHYIFLLLDKFSEFKYIRTLRFKMYVVQILQNLLDKNRFNQIEVKEFLRKINAYDFDSKLFESLNTNGINEAYFQDEKLKSLINAELDKFYKCILD